MYSIFYIFFCDSLLEMYIGFYYVKKAFIKESIIVRSLVHLKNTTFLCKMIINEL